MTAHPPPFPKEFGDRPDPTPDHLDEVDPRLIAELSQLFDEYGPAGVVNVATRMVANLRRSAAGFVPPPPTFTIRPAESFADSGRRWAQQLTEWAASMQGWMLR